MITRMYFDTETTGLLNFKAPVDDPSQPRVVQYAAILLDGSWNELGSVSLLRKPYGWEIPPGASTIHGINTAKAFAYGAEILAILSVFQSFAYAASQIVAHNLDFDIKMMAIEAAREKVPVVLDGKNFLCTMRAATPICRLPGRSGGYKWPKLSEAYKMFFGEELAGAHDALVDVRACARVHRHLIENKLIADVQLH